MRIGINKAVSDLSLSLDTLGRLAYTSLVAIRFKYGGIAYSVDTAAEAAQLIEALQSRGSDHPGDSGVFSGSNMRLVHDGPWNAAVFYAFINRMGATQKAALGLLLERQNVSDEELRLSLGVSSNQSLAGVLSGISKQAVSLNIGPREVFTVENLRLGGKRSSVYRATEKFRRVAGMAKWPPVDETLDTRLDEG